MEKKNKDSMPKLMELLNKDKKIKWLIIVGIILMLLIAISSFIPSKDQRQKEQITQAESDTTESYKQRLEAELYNMVTSIEGVGKAEIMITLKSGVEYVYAKEEKQNTDITNQAYGESGSPAKQQRSNYEQTTIMVEDQNGRKQALIRTTLEPSVRGVIVVCEGGDDINIQQRVTEAVKTALGIGSNNVCVAKLSQAGDK